MDAVVAVRTERFLAPLGMTVIEELRWYWNGPRAKKDGAETRSARRFAEMDAVVAARAERFLAPLGMTVTEELCWYWIGPRAKKDGAETRSARRWT